MAALLAAKELDMLDGYMYIAIAYTPGTPFNLSVNAFKS